MQRAAVLRLLRAHHARVADPHEAEMLTQVVCFVEAHSDCLLRTCAEGHLTGSAWIVDPRRGRTLLVHHRKLDKWLQPGGHADCDPDLMSVALREAREETGLTRLRVVSTELYDVDRHWIPSRAETPGHWHLDLRFLIEADPDEPLVVSEESHDLAWVELSRVSGLNPDASLRRMALKTPGS